MLCVKCVKIEGDGLVMQTEGGVTGSCIFSIVRFSTNIPVLGTETTR